jgi:hypothetical protein
MYASAQAPDFLDLAKNCSFLDGAFSDQRSANTLFLMSFAESLKLMADSANPKTLVSG